jgi:hypothetical protein
MLPNSYTTFTLEVKYDRYAGTRSNIVAVKVTKLKVDTLQLYALHATESALLTYTFWDDSSL